MTSQSDIKKLLNNYERRLQKLKEKNALRGLDAPIDTLIEIEDIEAEIERLKEELKRIADELERTPHKKFYSNFEIHVEKIPVSESLIINEIKYGEGSQIEHKDSSELLILDSEIKLPKKFIPSEGREAYIIKSLFNEQELNNFKINKLLHYPREIVVTGQKTESRNTIATYICADTFYFQNCDQNLSNEVFEVNCRLGRGGISDFVDRRGGFQNDNIFTLGDGLGAIIAIVAVEFDGKEPICRSKYIVAVRAGIRYPDDIWRSKKTNKPITSGDDNHISNARFIFQSRQPNGSSSDIFVADFNGERMYNLTERNEVAYDGFFDEKGNEVARWVDGEIEYGSMRNGIRQIVRARDPISKNEASPSY